ncbi:MAG: lipocalin family protein [bacterium]
MNRIIKYLATCVMLTACLSWLHCSDNNPTNPNSGLVGDWELVSNTAKATNATVTAGEIIDLGDGTTMKMTGSVNFTDKNITLSLTVTWTFAGIPPQTETLSISGTYTIDGSTMTIVEAGTQETETLTFSLNGSRLTLENDEQKSVFEKK